MEQSNDSGLWQGYVGWYKKHGKAAWIIVILVGLGFFARSLIMPPAAPQANGFTAAAYADDYARDMLQKEGYLNINLEGFPRINEDAEKTKFHIENDFTAEIHGRGIRGTYGAIIEFASGSYELVDIAFEGR